VETDSKKKVDSGYKRKNNSLGILAETFVSKFAAVVPSPLTGQELVIDHLAAELQVERRRIYDVVNILEALQLIVKRGQNTYHWMGKEHLDRQFALLQNQAVEQWPEAAVRNGLIPKEPPTNNSADLRSSDKSLMRLSQLFVQVFLVGHDEISLPELSDIIQGSKTTTDKLVELGSKHTDGGVVPEQDSKQYQQAAARGLKTKIRRLYDIANVLLAVGLLSRCETRDRRPQFCCLE